MKIGLVWLHWRHRYKNKPSWVVTFVDTRRQKLLPRGRLILVSIRPLTASSSSSSLSAARLPDGLLAYIMCSPYSSQHAVERRMFCGPLACGVARNLNRGGGGCAPFTIPFSHITFSFLPFSLSPFRPCLFFLSPLSAFSIFPLLPLTLEIG